MTEMAHSAQIVLETHLDSHKNSTQKQFPPSSPTVPLSSSQGSSKRKRKATVTPRTFTRFFTPRSSIGRVQKIGSSRKILRDITASGSNRSLSTPSKGFESIFGQIANKSITISRKRKRRTAPSQLNLDHFSSLKEQGPSLKMSSPSQSELSGSEDQPSSSGLEEQVSIMSENSSDQSSQHEFEDQMSIGDSEDQPSVSSSRPEPIKPLVFARQSSWSPYRSNFRRELLGMNTAQGYKCALHDYRNEVACFYSNPTDLYEFHKPPDENGIVPFCTASCNTNSLVAVGDEEGHVILLESGKHNGSNFKKPFLIFNPHSNAIMDLCFSLDDCRLAAAAAGDNTVKIIDMVSQETTHVLNHDTTVKQVRFQPGSLDIVATSSRNGDIKIWDLRCKGATGKNGAVQARPIDTIHNAHGLKGGSFMTWSTTPSVGGATLGSRYSDERGAASVTSLSFLNAGRENLFVTGSERNASVRLWDLRKMRSHRRHGGTALSTTDLPESHRRGRDFGLTSLALSGDGQRLYTQCTDSTVYAYATSHLLSGHAPELSSANSKPRASAASNEITVGPLYGFAHDAFKVNGFFVKMAIRPATANNSEVIAVGSTWGSPVLFPTDERYLYFSPYGFRPVPPSLSTQEARTSRAPSRHPDYIPIYSSGVKLEGHKLEVSGVAWTPAGDLITISDDYNVRCWRQGIKGEAKSVRARGRRDALELKYGFAAVDKEWDNDDE